jgi:hypothetical protein
MVEFPGCSAGVAGEQRREEPPDTAPPIRADATAAADVPVRGERPERLGRLHGGIDESLGREIPLPAHAVELRRRHPRRRLLIASRNDSRGPG